MAGLEQLHRALIVSCQAPEGSVLNQTSAMALMAVAAAAGGARGVRANGPANIAAIKAVISLPVIGLLKRDVPGSPVYITPTFADARLVAEAGADLVAVDATLRTRPDGATAGDLIRRIRDELTLPVVADVDGIAAAEMAARAGADFVATTLSGYTDGSTQINTLGPDLSLVRQLVTLIRCPIIAEGRYHQPQQLKEAFDAGAYEVVVGEAITDPVALTRRFVREVPPASRGDLTR